MGAERIDARDDEGGRDGVERLADLLRVTSDQLPELSHELADVIAGHVAGILKSAQTDSVTGALLRGAAARALARQLSHARRRHGHLTIAFIDFDYLKQLNDVHGHAAGDAALLALVQAFSERLRSYDFIGRWGGDEFVCVFPDCERPLAERIVNGIQAEFESRTGCTFTVGYAVESDAATVDDLLNRADRELYRRKRARAATVARLDGRPARSARPRVTRSADRRLNGSRAAL